MISIETTAKTVQQAIEEGLLRLNKTIDEVDIDIISSGGFLKKAKVKVTIIGGEMAEGKTVIKEEKEQQKPLKPAKTDNKIEQKAQSEKPKEKTERVEKAEKFEKSEKSERFEKSVKPTSQKPSEKSSEKPNEKIAEKIATEKPARAEKTDSGEQEGRERDKSEYSNSQRPRPERPRVERERTDRPDRPRVDRPRVERPRVERVSQEHNEVVEADQERERRERPKTPITEEITQKATQFVEQLLSKMNVEYTMTTHMTDGELTLSIKCDSGAIIGYRGETLDSIEYLTSIAINKSDDKYYRVNVDCNDYRSKRVETLTSLARRMAEKAVKTGRKVVLEPMSSSSRKVIHSVLAENERIITKSEGRDPQRRIIIIPKRFK